MTIIGPKNKKLISTISGVPYAFERIEEFAENGESLEVKIEGLHQAKINAGKHLWQRFSDFSPFASFDIADSLGEGNTPLLRSEKISQFLNVDNLFLKNETMNPTWSFKDRGSLACILMAKEMGEKITATISTGNMGASIAAYGARSNIQPLIFIPTFCPEEKIRAMTIHGATVVKVAAPDYGEMKRKVLSLAASLKLRIVSGNGPIRTEGYKFTAFELYEQLNGDVPDFIAVPTSACGHIRGVFKGFRELKEAGIIHKLPRMIIVQTANNSPLVSAWKKKLKEPIPFSNFHTIAEAITTGNPLGGNELLHKAYEYDWLAEDVSEEEILISQRLLAEAGFFVEPASATSLYAVKKLRDAGKIEKNESVVLLLTGSGLKDAEVFKYHESKIYQFDVSSLETDINKFISQKALS